MSGSDGSTLFSVAVWMMVGASAMFALNRISNLQHAQTATLERAAPPPRPEPADAPANSSDAVEIRADRSGHFHSSIEVNGRSVAAMVDTGATMVALTYEDAERSGLFLHERDFTGRTQTANGIARFAPVVLERVSIGGVQVRNVQGAVMERGALSVNLLGMSFLSRVQKFEVSSGRLVLLQ